MSKLVTRGACLIAWMAAIYYFSDQPNSNQVTENMFGSLNYFVRKGAHITEYGVLYLLAFWLRLSFEDDQNDNDKNGSDANVVNDEHATPDLNACDNSIDLEPKHNKFLRLAIVPAVFSVFYAISDEWHQSFVPGRSPLLSDVFIDSSGIGIAALLSFFFTV